MAISAAPGAVAHAAPESLQSYYEQAPAWTSCEPFIGDTTELPTARCANISVPVDYADPQGPQAKLAVIRVPASGQRLGVLLVSGYIVGDSLLNVALAGLIVATGKGAPLALVPADFAPATPLAIAAYALVAAGLYLWVARRAARA